MKLKLLVKFSDRFCIEMTSKKFIEKYVPVSLLKKDIAHVASVRPYNFLISNIIIYRKFSSKKSVKNSVTDLSLEEDWEFKTLFPHKKEVKVYALTLLGYLIDNIFQTTMSP